MLNENKVACTKGEVFFILFYFYTFTKKVKHTNRVLPTPLAVAPKFSKNAFLGNLIIEFDI